jgi:hypothetical protein
VSRALSPDEGGRLALNTSENTSIDDGVNVDVPRDGVLRISLNRPRRLNALDDIAIEVMSQYRACPPFAVWARKFVTVRERLAAHHLYEQRRITPDAQEQRPGRFSP